MSKRSASEQLIKDGPASKSEGPARDRETTTDTSRRVLKPTHSSPKHISPKNEGNPFANLATTPVKGTSLFDKTATNSGWTTLVLSEEFFLNIYF